MVDPLSALAAAALWLGTGAETPDTSEEAETKTLQTVELDEQLEGPEVSGSPNLARISLEGPAAAPQLSSVTLEAPPPQASGLLAPGVYEAVVATKSKLATPLGAAVLGFGLSGLGASVALLAVSSSPVRGRAALADTGVTLALLSSVAVVTGSVVLGIELDSRGRSEAPPASRIGILIGPTRVGVGVRF